METAPQSMFEKMKGIAQAQADRLSEEAGQHEGFDAAKEYIASLLTPEA